MSDGTVGFLGLGQMGDPMVRNLLVKGWDVVIAPRDPVKARGLVEAGARLVATPADIAPLTDLVLLCLPDTASVRDVLLGGGGLLTAGEWHGTVVDHSTLPPAASRQLAVELDARGIASLDAPISGGVRGATAGALSIMVGGPAEVLARVRPALEAMGSRVVHCGGHGAGQVTKACNQLIVMATTTAVAETLRLAEHAGVDPWVVREALMGGYAASPMLDIQGPRVIEGAHQPGGRAIFHAKDIAAIRELKAQAGLDLPLFDVVAAQFERLFDLPGGGELDHSAVSLLYPRSSSPSGD